MFDRTVWSQVPFPFWTLCFFVFGCVVGSFLNVCIYRMPRNESIVHPPSHCPHCGYAIPWYLNIPLVTWLWLRGRCANCGAPISVRYFLVELLTGIMFAACWICFGHSSPAAALVYAVLIAGLIAATFIDFEHFIIPDEITIGGMVAGFCGALLAPASHLSFPLFRPLRTPGAAMADSVIGMAVGAGMVYGILRLGKLLFGRYRISWPEATRIFFTETAVHLPNEEIAYEELFYRSSDTIRLQAQRVELIDRCYRDVAIRLQPERLQIGEDEFEPDKVLYLEAVTTQIVLPREAMGLGDVKFMAAIGAFLGWPAVLFSLAISSVIGAIVGVGLIVCKKQAWSSRLPYGPYIAAAAIIWMFGGYDWLRRLF
ncbi:MAG TPA: prepilin peptidase [Candidatus Saccharimonadales bacterium]|nr:prepilin peptidase [Candidatus Saccharimonadales bacterium]